VSEIAYAQLQQAATCTGRRRAAEARGVARGLPGALHQRIDAARPSSMCTRCQLLVYVCFQEEGARVHEGVEGRRETAGEVGQRREAGNAGKRARGDRKRCAIERAGFCASVCTAVHEVQLVGGRGRVGAEGEGSGGETREDRACDKRDKAR
jgi:hypothetical protein